MSSAFSHWVTKYVGHGHFDNMANVTACWNFVQHVLCVEYSIVLRPYDIDNYDQARTAVESEKESEHWRKLDKEELPKDGDVALFGLGSRPHVGVMINDDFMIHLDSGDYTAKVEWIGSVRWRNRQHGIYRHSSRS